MAESNIKYSAISETEVGVSGYKAEPEGQMIIPRQVKHNGKTYEVVKVCASAFSGCTRLREVSLPDSIVTIEEKAFAGCSHLEKVKLPACLNSVREYAFAWCMFRRIEFPEELVSIGRNAFIGCTQLSEVCCMDLTPEAIDAQAFDPDTLAQATLVVPPGTEQRYGQMEGWKRFSYIRNSSSQPFGDLFDSDDDEQEE